MKRKLLITLGLALMLTLLVAVGAMAASDKLVISGYADVTAGFTGATPTVTLKSSNATVSGVLFSSKPAKYAEINADTGALTGIKPGKVTVTATYKDEATGKTIKGTKTVKIVKNEFVGAAPDRSTWTTGYKKTYSATKRLYFQGDYLCAEMWIYNYIGSVGKPGVPASGWAGALIDNTTLKYVTNGVNGSKYLGGVNKNSRIAKKGRFAVLFKFDLTAYPELREKNLRTGSLRVVNPLSEDTCWIKMVKAE